MKNKSSYDIHHAESDTQLTEQKINEKLNDYSDIISIGEMAR